MDWIRQARELLDESIKDVDIKVISACCGLEPGPSAMSAIGGHAEFFSFDNNPLLRSQILHANGNEKNVHCGDVSGDIEELDPEGISEVDSLVATPPFEKCWDPADSKYKFLGFGADRSTPIIVVLIMIKAMVSRQRRQDEDGAFTTFCIELPIASLTTAQTDDGVIAPADEIVQWLMDTLPSSWVVWKSTMAARACGLPNERKRSRVPTSLQHSSPHRLL